MATVTTGRGTSVAVGSINTSARGLRAVVFALLIPALLGAGLNLSCCSSSQSAEPKSIGNPFSGLSSSSQRKQVLASLPMNRLTPQARKRITSIAKSPTIYRRLPTQAIDCDRDMFLFLTRNSETLVGLWDLMGITQVQTRRTGKYQLEAQDGAGTTCTVDLIYGDSNLHIFVADGMYDGKMTAKPIKGSGVFVLRSGYAKSASGSTTVTGTLDVFVQFHGIGTDLIVRTLSGVIGRSADSNFTETARFIGQVSQASAKNPPAMVDVAGRLPQVDDVTKKQFAEVIAGVAARTTLPSRAAEPNVNVQPPRTAVRTLTRRTK
ncbi:hypothetical protein [Planctomycetes bacterium K23_9]|uniref:hypothetical protein n=1 Tax=Stieleria marina TaxID=1930275 RepID=UPI00119E2076